MRAAAAGLVFACIAGCGLGGSATAVLDSGYKPCVENLLKIGLALHQHHDDLGSFPKAAITDKQGRPGLSWRVAILPFLGEKLLYDKFKLDEPWDSPHNKALLSEMPEVFACPSVRRSDKSITHYCAFVGHGAFLEPAYDKRLEKVWWTGEDGVKHYIGEPQGGRSVADFTDGMSNTLMVVEAKEGVPWTKPEDLPFDPARPTGPLFGAGSPHSGGFNAVFADAWVWFLPNSISPQVFRALITCHGNEVVSLEGAEKLQGRREQPAPPEPGPYDGPVMKK
jgi:hypothetical protein